MKIDREVLSELKQHASRSAARSHSPYSRFVVGAAVLTDDRKIYAGCNVENASFGLTQCAERNAMNCAIAEGAQAGTLQVLMIYTPGERVHPPCGACRQVMIELMANDAAIFSTCDTDETKQWGLKELLRDPFDPRALPTFRAGNAD